MILEDVRYYKVCEATGPWGGPAWQVTLGCRAGLRRELFGQGNTSASTVAAMRDLIVATVEEWCEENCVGRHAASPFFHEYFFDSKGDLIKFMLSFEELQLPASFIGTK